MSLNDSFGVRKFLSDYPGMFQGPMRSSSLLLKGCFSFEANSAKGNSVRDSYDLEINVPSTFPKIQPSVTEVGGKIPRDGNFHVNPDGTLCLGSPLRVLSILTKRPNLVGFAENCIVPFLYAISHKLMYGGGFIFSELAHGGIGVIDDYLELFRVESQRQVVQTLNLIGMKRRIANKKPCPCECGKRLGKCVFNKKVRAYRSMTARSWFKGHVASLRNS